MELRQLRYFVALAEELHFGRAAARQHIVQSALSQQLSRLERELKVLLLERSTHHVQLTPAGSALLVEARQILAHVERAANTTQQAARLSPTLRVGTVDPGYDSMPQILRRLQQRYPELEIHLVEAGVPQQYELLADGRLDVGFGRASLAPAHVDFDVVRLDPLGVLVACDHRLAALPGVPVGQLTMVPLLLGEEQRSPEFNQFSSSSAGRSASRPPCTGAPSRASAPPPTWSRRVAACCVCRPRTRRRPAAPCGDT